jgi:hypothetical protein
MWQYCTRNNAVQFINVDTLHSPGRRWNDNTKMDLTKIGGGGEDCIHVAQDMDQWRALVNTVMNLWVP